jgi:putative protease
MTEEKPVGEITHYFTNIGVAVIELSDTLKTGDTIAVRGATSEFTQKVDSMQIEHEKVGEAKKGQSVGLKVKERVRQGDQVFKVVE